MVREALPASGERRFSDGGEAVRLRTIVVDVPLTGKASWIGVDQIKRCWEWS